MGLNDDIADGDEHLDEAESSDDERAGYPTFPVDGIGSRPSVSSLRHVSNAARGLGGNKTADGADERTKRNENRFELSRSSEIRKVENIYPIRTYYRTSVFRRISFRLKRTGHGRNLHGNRYGRGSNIQKRFVNIPVAY